MPTPSLSDCDRFLKRVAMTRSPDANEAAVARRQVEEMLREFPSIQRQAAAATSAISAPYDPMADIKARVKKVAETPEWEKLFAKAATTLVGVGLDQAVDAVAGGSDYRQKPVGRRNVAFKVHECREDHLCFELRMRLSDAVDSDARADIVSKIARLIRDLALDAQDGQE